MYWEARPQADAERQRPLERPAWQHFQPAATVQEGSIRAVINCAAVQVTRLAQQGPGAALITYTNQALIIGDEVRRIVAVAFDADASAAPEEEGGAHGGVVRVDTCFTQPLEAGLTYSVFRGYRIDGLSAGTGSVESWAAHGPLRLRERAPKRVLTTPCASARVHMPVPSVFPVCPGSPVSERACPK